MTLFIGEREITPTIITKGGGSTDKYKVGDIVYDDNNTAIGTISGFKTDANNVTYAVCCLNGGYRGSGAYYYINTDITNMPMYSDQTVWSNKETATTNTDYILAMSETSSACNLCRAASFVINGVTYYGQLPTIDELVDIFKNRIIINSQDSSGNNPIPTTKSTWSSTQYDSKYGWYIDNHGSADGSDKAAAAFVCPVLEIPLEN